MDMRLVFMPMAVDVDKIVICEEFPVSQYFKRAALPCYPFVFIKHVNDVGNFLKDMQVMGRGNDCPAFMIGLQDNINYMS